MCVISSLFNPGNIGKDNTVWLIYSVLDKLFLPNPDFL